MDLKYAEVFPARSVYVFRPDKHNIRDRCVIASWWQVNPKLVKNWSSKGSTTLQIGSKAVAWSSQTLELSPKRFQAIRGPDFGPHLGCHLGGCCQRSPSIRGWWFCIECRERKSIKEFSAWRAKNKTHNGRPRCNQCSRKQLEEAQKIANDNLAHVLVQK